MDESQDSPVHASLLNEREVRQQTGRAAMRAFLDQHTLYDMMRDSGKVVVFDTSIPIQLAFYALLEHGTRAAPLWDASRREFVALLTTTDFIDLLRHHHKQGTPLDVLSSRTISEVMADASGRKLQHPTFVSASPESSLAVACDLLKTNRYRFLPVLAEDMRVVSIISYHDIMKFIVSKFKDPRQLFEDPLFELGIATPQSSVLAVKESDSLESVLGSMEERDISSIPVLDDTGRVSAVYSRSDIKFITAASDAEGVTSNLSLSLKEIFSLHQDETAEKEEYITCSPTASLQSVLEKFSVTNFHRAVCVDIDNRCVGVVSVKDLVSYLSSGV